MSDDAIQLLKSFDALSPTDRRAVLTELLRRTRSAEGSGFTDEELTTLADELFLGLDAEESDDALTQTR